VETPAPQETELEPDEAGEAALAEAGAEAPEELGEPPVDVAAGQDAESPFEETTPPGPEEITPEPEEVTPPVADITPQPEEITPGPEEITPGPEEITPEPEEVTPPLADITPQPEETTPDPEEAAPEPEEVTPPSEVAPEPDEVAPHPEAVAELGPEVDPGPTCQDQCTAQDPVTCHSSGAGRWLCEQVGDCWEWVYHPCPEWNTCSLGPEECFVASSGPVCRPKITIPPEITDPIAQDAYWIAESTKGCGTLPVVPEHHPDCTQWNCIDGSVAPPVCEVKGKTSLTEAGDCDLDDVCVAASTCFEGQCVVPPEGQLCPIEECNKGVVDLLCDGQAEPLSIQIDDLTKSIDAMDAYGCEGFGQGYGGPERIFKVFPEPWSTAAEPAYPSVRIELADPKEAGMVRVDAFWWIPDSQTAACYPNLCQGASVMDANGQNVIDITIPLFPGAGQSQAGPASAAYLILDTQDSQAGWSGKVRVAVECHPGLGAESFCGDGQDTDGDGPDCWDGTAFPDPDCKGSLWCPVPGPDVGIACPAYQILPCGETLPDRTLAQGASLVSGFACADQASGGAVSYAGKKQVAFLAAPPCSTGTFSVTFTHKSGQKAVDMFGLPANCVGAACTSFDEMLSIPWIFGDPPTLSFNAAPGKAIWLLVTETYDLSGSTALFDVLLDCSTCQ
jgi:hypothetical protein